MWVPAKWGAFLAKMGCSVYRAARIQQTEHVIQKRAMADLGGTIRDDATTKSSAQVPQLPHLFVVLECARPAVGGACLRIEGVDEVVLARGASRGAALENGLIFQCTGRTRIDACSARNTRAVVQSRAGIRHYLGCLPAVYDLPNKLSGNFPADPNASIALNTA